ncbi:MAG: GTP cyclohydrolase I, partial [Candidatus Diapherotrites archaeon]|nr:GTP cyclohydrolase I [Candidatus Diapherotrites archaeon]
IGKAHIGYIPDKHLIGLSKIPRVVDYFSKKPQLQERMGQEIRDYLFDLIKPKAIYVYLDDVVHTCVLARGIEKESKTDTFTSKSGNIDKQLYITKMNEFLSRIGR